MFRARYADVYKGDVHWQAIDVTGSDTYQWRAGSTYVANPPYFEGLTMTPPPVTDIVGAKPLAILGGAPVRRDPMPPRNALGREQRVDRGRRVAVEALPAGDANAVLAIGERHVPGDLALHFQLGAQVRCGDQRTQRDGIGRPDANGHVAHAGLDQLAGEHGDGRRRHAAASLQQ